MNRRKFFFNTLAASTTLLVGSQAFNSCKKKDDPAPRIKDVVDTATADKLKETVLDAATVAALPTVFTTAAAALPTVMTSTQITAFNTVNVNPLIDLYKKNIEITAEEKTKLQANDGYTLNTVINRMLTIPAFTSESELSSIKEAIASKTQLDEYLLQNKTAGSDLYANSFYDCALDTQKYVQTYTIPMLEKMVALSGTENKSASLEQSTAAAGGNWFALLLSMIMMMINELKKILKELLTNAHKGGTAS